MIAALDFSNANSVFGKILHNLIYKCTYYLTCDSMEVLKFNVVYLDIMYMEWGHSWYLI